MTWRSRAIGLGSLLTSALILWVGWSGIQRKVRQGPSINDDDILTRDELATVPPGTLVAMLPRTSGSSPDEIPYRVLRLALRKSGRPFVLGFADVVSNQQTAIDRLASSPVPSAANPVGLTVGVFGVGPDIRRRLEPVPLPVMGGLLGLRGLWVHARRRDRFRAVERLEDLAGVVAAQGIGWSDARILRRAGITTFSDEPSRLFELLEQDRVDTIPKGLPELEEDARRLRERYRDIALDPHLLLVYPFAQMFFLHPDQDALAEAIEEGFRRAIADGSYERLLRDHLLTPWVRRRLRLRQRRILVIGNPDARTILDDVPDDLWLVPWPALVDGTVTRGEQLCGQRILGDLC